ncbi:MAG: hypothetical protein AB7G93_17650 [Bdellovibrionales bacterium]
MAARLSRILFFGPIFLLWAVAFQVWSAVPTKSTFRGTLGPGEVDGKSQLIQIEVKDSQCRITTGDEGIIHALNTIPHPKGERHFLIQVIAVEFPGSCWLFFSRIFERDQHDLPPFLLTGRISLGDRGLIAMDYADLGSAPSDQLKRLANRLSESYSEVSAPLLPIPLNIIPNH